MSFSVPPPDDSAPPNLLAGFERPLHGEGKRGERGRKGEERKGTERTEQNTPEMNFWLRSWSLQQ